MKKITHLILLLPTLLLAQSKATNPISVQNYNAGIVLNNDTQTATITMVGPSDRWLALQFGQFSGGMEADSDVVYFNGTTLVDATHNGIGIAPSADAQNNWTVTQNTVSSGVRTLTATRPFNSPDATDYDFNYNDATIGLALARGSGASFTLSNHGSTNRIVNTSVSFTTLGLEDVSLNATEIYPNPSKGNFTIKTKTGLQQINVYSQTGAFVRTIKFENQNNSNEIAIDGLQTGVYLMELVNANEKSWKKIIIE